MPSPLAALLAEVRGLAEKATPGDWIYGRHQATSKDEMIAYLINCVEVSPLADQFYLVGNGDWSADICHTGNGPTSEANAALVVAMKRLLPRLLALAEGEGASEADAAGNPIPMVLHCPSCGAQHVDAPEPERGWTNPPHKSHLCHRCGVVWRPADVPTTGVRAITTRGDADTWTATEPKATPPAPPAPGEAGTERAFHDFVAKLVAEFDVFDTQVHQLPDASTYVTVGLLKITAGEMRQLRAALAQTRAEGEG